jgi:photosynthetic reaction center cytochrome c subunit
MKKQIALGALFAAGLLQAQAPEVKTAEQVYKNIVQLKGTPADQLVPTMQFISAALGVECSTCHVDGKPEADDKRTKVTARQMIAMTMTINKEQRNVTCFTCHRGSEQPVNVPPVQESDAAPAPPRPAAPPPGPAATADDILAKYVNALGGADAMKKITSRSAKGTITAMGSESSIDLLTKAPNKRVSISHSASGDSFTAFDGTAGWMGNTGRPARDMSTYSSFASGLDAEFYLGLRLKEMFPQLRAGRPTDVAGVRCQVLSGTKAGVGQVSLYFDANSGLLMRVVRSEITPLGRNLTQIDYADYREVDGVKTPWRWTLSRPNGRFTIQLKELKDNVAVDDSKFAKPSGDVK